MTKKVKNEWIKSLEPHDPLETLLSKDIVLGAIWESLEENNRKEAIECIDSHLSAKTIHKKQMIIYCKKHRFKVIKEKKGYSSHCIEDDRVIVTQGDTMKELRANIKDAMDTYLDGENK